MSQPEDLGKWFRRTAKASSPDHYQLLGIKRFEADPKRILQVINQKVEFLHEVSGHQDYTEHAQRLLNQIAKAKICLTNAKQKSSYDQQLIKAEQVVAAPPVDLGALPPPKPKTPSVRRKPTPPTPNAAKEQAEGFAFPVWFKPLAGLLLLGVIVGLVVVLLQGQKRGENGQQAANNPDNVEPVMPRSVASQPWKRKGGDKPKEDGGNQTESKTNEQPTRETTPGKNTENESGDRKIEAEPQVKPTKPTFLPENGTFINGVTVTGSDFFPDLPYNNLINGSGIGWDKDNPLNERAQRNDNRKFFWHAGKPKKPAKVDKQYLVFKFPSQRMLTSIYIWNYSHKGQESRAVDELEILLSSEEDPATATFTSLGTFQLKKVLGGNQYADRIDTKVRKVRLVKFRIISAQSGKDSEFVGLGEVRFFMNSHEQPEGAHELALPTGENPNNVENTGNAGTQPPKAEPIPSRSDVELPALTDLKPAQLFKFPDDYQEEVSLDFFASPNPKFSFEARKDSDASLVTIMRVQKDTDPQGIAELRLKDKSVLFQWLETAAADESNNLLRNGLVKLTAGTEKPFWIQLRKPVVLEPFQFSDAGQADTRSDTELPWLPEKRDLKVQIAAFADAKIASSCNPDTVVGRDPAKLFFIKDPKNQLVWFEVNFTVRKSKSSPPSLRLNAKIQELLPRIDGPNARQRPRETQVSELVNFKAAYVRAANAFKQQINKLPRRSPDRGTLGEQVKELTRFANLCDTTGQRIKQAYQQNIPTTVFVEVEGQKVIIATSK
jgi:hypothetical protein